jgi:hypothetical protein
LAGVANTRDFVSPRVVVGFHSWGSVPPRFAFALARACAYEGNKIAGVIPVQSPFLEDARNQIVKLFLEQFPDAQYLLQVDADIEFPSDAIGKSIYIISMLEQEVLYGCYALGDGRNSIFSDTDDSELFRMIDVQGPATYLNIRGGGTGWMLARREALEKIKEFYPGPNHWFGRDPVKDEKGEVTYLGEDLTFGLRCRSLGIKQAGTSQLALLHYKERAIIPQPLMVLLPNQFPQQELENENPPTTEPTLKLSPPS